MGDQSWERAGRRSALCACLVAWVDCECLPCSLGILLLAVLHTLSQTGYSGVRVDRYTWIVAILILFLGRRTVVAAVTGIGTGAYVHCSSIVGGRDAFSAF